MVPASALINVAGHARKVDAEFEILQEARIQGKQLGVVAYSSSMGACSNQFFVAGSIGLAMQDAPL
uniref:Uncharacterized protein n=1 Tax=Rhizophora mucronata TaxID=61149 RepID=A0A2P2NUX4_RHIMU